ncbi:MAG TPA: hypothetical protein VE135_18635 [Pyrinomonadaceae bacterium]|nr:hypothetical protein [Pyrinomonadaceae bacterium]
MRVQPSASQTAAACVVLLLVLTAPTFAQSTRNPNSPAQRGMQAREWALTHIPDEVNKHFQKEQTSLFAQIREDFRRLQIINNEMMRTVFVNSNVDRKLIAVTTAEINKRAMRLSANLVLPRIDDQAKNQKPDDARNDGNLQAGLLALDHCIMSFVANPLFKQPNVVDSESALRARSDLNLIIRLSERLKKDLGN